MAKTKKNPTVTHKLEKITPKQAAEYLSKNTHNRPKVERQISLLAGHMERGTFQFDGSPVRFSVSGVLLDGQHRLSAVVRSGKAQEFLVIRGLPDEAQLVMDQNTKRTLGDNLVLTGSAKKEDAAHLQSVIRLAATFANGGSSEKAIAGNGVGYDLTQAEQIEFFQDNRDRIVEAGEIAKSFSTGQFPVLKRVLAYAAFALLSTDEAEARTFFKDLKSGIGLDATDPVYLLREKLLGASDKDMYRDKKEHLALIFKAWNLRRQGETRTRLFYRATGSKAEPFPVPA